MDTGVVEESWRGERRLRLLEAAASVFARQPYHAASMDEIAQEAGVGKPTLYRYFPGKEALFAAVFVKALDDLELRLAAVLAQESGVERQLGGLVRVMIPTFRHHLVALRFLGQDAAAVDQSQRRIFRERRARIAGFLSDAIRGGIVRGEVPATRDPGRLAHLVIGMIWSGTSSLSGTDQEIAAEVAGVILHGICEATPGRVEPNPSGTRPTPTDTQDLLAPRRRISEAAG